ncbi:KTN1 [Lepeophtheirus salmonis]|uniref:KTN1 n=1 Tax=Lepeophtheirus salmonis TaxID=72036 RepID=A0A7R8HCI8_LEPSM|nr:KTN1 [Lepeophtheirus salmonis]CAF3005857.1 KTN1 [Lepeophtheirus salmonis]
MAFKKTPLVFSIATRLHISPEQAALTKVVIEESGGNTSCIARLYSNVDKARISIAQEIMENWKAVNKIEKEYKILQDKINKTADETTTETQVCSGNGRRVDLSNECREVCRKRTEKRRREKSKEGDYSQGKSTYICKENDEEEVFVEDQDINGVVDIQGIPWNKIKPEIS